MSASPFAMKLAAFREAKAAYARHNEACEPARHAPSAEQIAYEEAYMPLANAMAETALGVVKCPATSLNDLAEKIEIFRAEDMHKYEDAGDLIDFIVDDARRIGGVA